ncbi:M61 family metallopeptidase [Paucibacter sp. DJ2R-2]|uniref:M61 family metallopeptidase n=1 Tax=Paucibacter sp. DJ2R-2 TaxID=2893558 RepID=UPI0021E3B05A|nr:PDZ domain-containing protein [Paucibacter sp. DJ2R-2]MCV2420384.1 PDZ domain-containing protein [Paucibacter sp. DJ4R-1]MCV2436671.1 PDZ domain-containing protein [Paucibacter sp. DJ2R-2]
MADIRYRVEIDSAHDHHFQLTLTIAAPAAEQHISLPAWIPGSYLLREFARHLSGLSASQGSRQLELEQLDKASWRVACSGRSALVLRYRVYAFDPSVRAAFLDAQRGFFNGSSLCLRVHGREDQPHVLELARLPEGWQVATAMPQQADGSYRAADYDELLDHPFELGHFWQGQFLAGGVEHQLVVSGAMPSFDGERLLADTQRICEAQIQFWHGAAAKRRSPVPFQRYVFFLNTVDEGYGGLEHRASTALLSPRRDLPRQGQSESSDGYVRLLGLISHEYFHTWNVKRLKPSNYVRLDYAQENYTELLWFFEGFTSYYDELILVRAGLIDEARYLKLLSSTLSGVLATPGRKVQSLAQASFDAWIKYYRQDENSPNSSISYYGKGALLALALDLSLRLRHADGEAATSLDELMRGLWQRHAVGEGASGGISEADIFGLLAEIGGPALAQQLGEWVHGIEDLPLPPLFERMGVQLRADKASLAQRLGLRLNDSAGSLLIKQVLAGSPASAAGLCAGDEVLACNGWRLRRLDEAVLTLAPGEFQLRLLVARDQRIVELQADLPATSAPGGAAVGASSTPVQLCLADKAPARALSLRRAWLAG